MQLQLYYLTDFTNSHILILTDTLKSELSDYDATI